MKFSKLKKGIYLMMSTALLSTTFIPTAEVVSSALESNQIQRIAGRDRVDTSIKASELVNSKVLILASGYAFADSLSAANVANKTGGKVVLVGDNTDVYSIFKDRQIERIYIVGGKVSKNVENSARKLTSNIKRLEGEDRYQTNAKTLAEFNFSSVGVADGRNYPDALAASPLLKKEGLGLKLVDGSKGYKESRSVKYTFGDRGSVRQDGGIRIAGATRYDTGNRINERIGKTNVVSFVNGENYPDALSAINVTTSNGASVVLVGRNGNDGAKTHVNKASRGYIIGGEVRDSSVDNIIGKTSSNTNNSNVGNNTGNTNNGTAGNTDGSSSGTNTNTQNPTPDEKVEIDIFDVVSKKVLSYVNVDKDSDYTKATIPNGYKVIPNQVIDKNYPIKRLYVTPSSYTIATSLNQLDEIMGRAVINQMEEKKNIVLAVTEDYRSQNNISQDNYSIVEPVNSNNFIYPMGFKGGLVPKGDYISSNSVFIKYGDIGYEIDQKYWTDEEFDRNKHIEYINKGIDILKSIGVYENNSMSDYDKAKKISEWIWENSAYSPVLHSRNIQGIDRLIARKNRSPYSILEFREGVCEGYSYATSFLFNIAGIRVNTEENKTHKWNIFKFNEEWIKIDNTDFEYGQNLTWERALNDFNTNPNKYKDGNFISDENMDKAYNFIQSLGYDHLK